VWYIRHGGTFGYIFSFFEAPIRNSRIRSLRSHRTVCGPERPARNTFVSNLKHGLDFHLYYLWLT
jgi:hypothetical protein